MYCLKCGDETVAEKIFCEACLQSMDQYPVKPGTAIHLPRQDSSAIQKKAPQAKRVPSAEEQVIYLKKVLRWMGLLLIVAGTALAAAVLQLLSIT